MSSPKRLALFFVLSIVMMMGTSYLMKKLGFEPEPAPAPAEPAANAPAAPGQPQPGDVANANPAQPAEAKAAPAAPRVDRKEAETVKSSELILGASDNPDPSQYRLELRFDQIGAGVRQLLAARFDGETNDGIPDRKIRLQLITDDVTSRAPVSFSMTVQPNGRPTVEGAGAFPNGEEPLDVVRWEVVRETPGGPTVKSITKNSTDGKGQVEGQQIVFRTVAGDPAVTVTKTFRVWKGEDGFEFDLTFDSAKDASIAYRLFGPHGVPIEGEAFTSNFRDVFFGQVNGKSLEVVTRPASDIVKNEANPERLQRLPIKFAGVENQYFAVFLSPNPTPTPTTRWDREALAFVAKKDEKNTAKSDVGIELSSIPFTPGPNHPITHSYRVFAGPKTTEALTPYEATDLVAYRKPQWFSIPFASTLAQSIIAPGLQYIYGLTRAVARVFGFQNGNYGIAIILLTMTVRLIMFPVGRKQAMISKKMQDLAPYLAEIKEKYKDDKERQTKETFALYKQHGFNPAAGCLPALIQMPIFVGLWQALNNSVALRHSQFLYIKNLAAPDMLFPFPTEIPFIGKYFNLLPLLVVSLMLVQTKLFSPPAVTEEAKAQQSMMKYMMIFMAFMFYRVPSGLGIYFITSSLWQVSERLLLPKITKAAPAPAVEVFNEQGKPVSTPDNPRPGGWFARKLEELMEQANNERTIRNNEANGNGRNDRNNPPPDRNRNRPRPGKRR